MEAYLTYYLLPVLLGLAILTITLIWRSFYLILSSSINYYDENMPLARKKETLYLVGRILTGQSAALVGFFNQERTDILTYLNTDDPEQKQILYGDKAENLLIQYLNIEDFKDEVTPFEFWERALVSLDWKLESLEKEQGLDLSDLKEAYQACKAQNFKTLALEKLFGLMNQYELRLVLLLDKFDVLLKKPQLGENGEFLASLRTLAASRASSPLVLIVSSYLSIKDFHDRTKDLNPYVSPVLNFIEGGLTILKGISDSEVDELLKQQAPMLSKNARQIIKKLVGGHPYLLKLAVSEWWKNEFDENEGYDSIEAKFYGRVEYILISTFKSWSEKSQQAIKSLAEQRDITEFRNELRELEVQGFILQVNGEWQIRTHVMLMLLEKS